MVYIHTVTTRQNSGCGSMCSLINNAVYREIRQAGSTLANRVHVDKARAKLLQSKGQRQAGYQGK